MFSNCNFKRCLHTTLNKYKKISPTNLKGKKTSSQHWLTRQLSDPYIEKAKMMNYRCRSAFKLLEIDDRFKILYPGQTVIDCGAAPGSWTQVAVSRVNADGASEDKPRGNVISVDQQQIFPIEGATILGNSDFTTDKTQEAIRNILNNREVNAVISDMAPNATGIGEMDKENMIKLCYTALRFAVQVSSVDALLIVKLWQCGQYKTLENDISRFYDNVRTIKPIASRSDSAEIFLMGRGFKGLKTNI